MMHAPGAVDPIMGAGGTNMLALTLFRHFDFGDNIVMGYAFNIFCMAMIPLLTTQAVGWFAYFKNVILKILFPVVMPKDRASVKFTASHGWDGQVEASVEMHAWLWHIRTKVVPKIVDGKRAILNLVQKKNKSQMTYNQYGQHVKDDGGAGSDQSYWPAHLTDQQEIYEHITCSMNEDAQSSQPPPQGDDAAGAHHSKKISSPTGPKTLSHMILFTDVKHGPDYILQITKKIVKEYQASLAEELTRGPQIFYYDSMSAQNQQKNAYGLASADTANAGWESVPFSSTREIDHIWFEQKETLLRSYFNFLDNPGEYRRRGDPYTFSALLYGLPGCGKTSLIKALVNLDRKRGTHSHLFNINIAELRSVKELRRLIFSEKCMEYTIPLEDRIYIFEDFDAKGGSEIFYSRKILKKMKVEQHQKKREDAIKNMLAKLERDEARKKEIEQFGEELPDFASDDEGANKVQSGGMDQFGGGHGMFGGGYGGNPSGGKSTLTLSDILNILDGVNERTGMRCFWTTNVMPPEDYFDPAFLRPGRMDMIICFTKCSKPGIAYLIDQYFDSTTDVESLEGIDDYRITPAELKQICKQTLDPKGVIDQLRELSELARQNEEEAKKAEEEEKLEKQRRISLLKKRVAMKKKEAEPPSTPLVVPKIIGGASETGNLFGGAAAVTPIVDDDDSEYKKADAELENGGEAVEDGDEPSKEADNDEEPKENQEEEIDAKVDEDSSKAEAPPKFKRVVSHPSGHVVGEIIAPPKLMPRSST